MSDELQKNDESDVLNAAVQSETATDEQILWIGRPDTDAMALPLLPFPIFWLSGLFVFSIGVLKNTATDTTRILAGMVFLLVVVAVMGVIEIIAVPWQARRAIYVITDKRTFILKLRGKFGYADLTNYQTIRRRLVRPERGTLMFYFCYTIPIHLVFCYFVFDLVTSLVNKIDPFVVAGGLLIMIGWVYQCYSDLRYPLPQLRECPRAFYFINEWLATVETMPHEIVKKSILRTRKSGCGDIFLVGASKGCMRIKSLPQAQDVYATLMERIKKK